MLNENWEKLYSEQIMTCSGEKQSYFGRSSCGLVSMTRTVSLSWVLLKGLQLVVCLACTAFIPTVFALGQECNLRKSFDSTFLQASYREEAVLDAGCQTSIRSLLRHTHVLNYKSMHNSSTPANILVNIDSQSALIQTKTLVLVLNSNVSVEWEVELQSPSDLDVTQFKFVISRTSTLHFASQSRQYQVNNSSPPVDDQELLTWVRSQYGSVASYSAFHDVDEVTMVINKDASAPSVCNLTSHQSPGRAYTLEDQTIWGCATGRYDVVNRRQIHVIELFSPSKYVAGNSEKQAEVNIQKGENSEEGPRDTLLILVSLSPTFWNVQSPVIDGRLTILSNNRVDPYRSGFSSKVEMKHQENIMATKKGLLQWIEQEYGPVSSFSHVRVANQFQLYLAGPVPVSSTTPTTSLGSTAVREDADRSENSELANGINISCETLLSIQVVVPSDLVDKYDLEPKAVTWRNKNCSANWTEGSLVLTSGVNTCGNIQSEDSEGAFVVSNQVTFYSAPVSEGSGGMILPDDDEDSVQILAQRTVTCKYDVKTIPFEPIPDPLPTDVSLYLDLYTDINFAVKKTVKPYRVEIGDPIYFEMGVTRDPRLNIIIGECWVGLPQEKLFEQRLNSVTVDGCPVEPSFQYLPVEYRPHQTEMPEGTVKRFTLNIAALDEYVMTFYVFCNLSLCTREPLLDHPQIVMCSSVPKENARCSEWKQLKLWPMKHIEMGPFRISSREQWHNNNLTGESKTDPSKNEAGTLEVTSPIFAAVIFIAFCIGVLLVSSLWLITKYTRVPSSASPANSPVGNGHIPNGHLPNGEAHHEMQPFIQDGVNPNNIPHEGLYDGFGDPQA